MKLTTLVLLFLSVLNVSGQKLKLKDRPPGGMSGSAFSASIRDTSISLEEREKIIFNEIRSGNVPDFYRNLVEIRDTIENQGQRHTIRYYVIPDFLAIG